MGEEKYPEGWIVVDHIIPGVTEEMLDWWWVNMEKGYELWCPDEHKGFQVGSQAASGRSYRSCPDCHREHRLWPGQRSSY